MVYPLFIEANSEQEESIMPKMKTHKGASKRFSKTGSGKVKRSHAFTSHFFRHKSQKQNRKLRQETLVAKTDEDNIKRLLDS